MGRKHSHHYTFPTRWSCSHFCGFWNGLLQDSRQVADKQKMNFQPFCRKNLPSDLYLKVSLEGSSLLQRDMLIFIPCSRAVMLTERQKAYHAEEHILTAAHAYLKLPLTVNKSPPPKKIPPFPEYELPSKCTEMNLIYKLYTMTFWSLKTL